MSETALSSRAEQAQQVIESALSPNAPSDLLSRIDALVQEAAASLRADAASLSMLTDRQVTLSACSATDQVGTRGEEAAFENTICANALRSNDVLDIPDANQDPRVSSIPAVRGGGIAAYLGVPIRYRDSLVGVLCAAVDEPREWTDADKAVLTAIADQVLALLASSAEQVSG